MLVECPSCDALGFWEDETSQCEDCGAYLDSSLEQEEYYNEP